MKFHAYTLVRPAIWARWKLRAVYGWLYAPICLGVRFMLWSSFPECPPPEVLQALVRSTWRGFLLGSTRQPKPVRSFRRPRILARDVIRLAIPTWGAVPILRFLRKESRRQDQWRRATTPHKTSPGPGPGVLP